MAALSLSAAAPRRAAAAAQPARLAGGVAAVRLSARRSDALSAGSVALRLPTAAPKAAARVAPTEAKLKTRKSAAKRYKVTGSGKVRSSPRISTHSQAARSPLAAAPGHALDQRCVPSARVRRPARARVRGFWLAAEWAVRSALAFAPLALAPGSWAWQLLRVGWPSVARRPARFSGALSLGGARSG